MNQLTRVKICGITRTEDALVSERHGADALGFVFVKASKRFIEPEAAKTIIDQIGPFITQVGLFLEAPASEIEKVLNIIPGLLPQFHGRETPEECERYGVPYIKAIGLGAGMPSTDELAAYKNASAFLFDSNEPGKLGGTGHVFDWQQLDQNVGKPIVLAGGLNPDNVASAIEQIRPYAIDVSSGVEASKGVKDHAALRAFLANIKHADANSR